MQAHGSVWAEGGRQAVAAASVCEAHWVALAAVVAQPTSLVPDGLTMHLDLAVLGCHARTRRSGCKANDAGTTSSAELVFKRV
jgi:hypothetical protein